MLRFGKHPLRHRARRDSLVSQPYRLMNVFDVIDFAVSVDSASTDRLKARSLRDDAVVGLSRRSLTALRSLSEDLTELSPTAMLGFGTLSPWHFVRFIRTIVAF